MSYVAVALTDENLFVRAGPSGAAPARRADAELRKQRRRLAAGSRTAANAPRHRVARRRRIQRGPGDLRTGRQRIAGPAAAATAPRGNRRAAFGRNRAWPRTAAAGAPAGGVGAGAARLGTAVDADHRRSSWSTTGSTIWCRCCCATAMDPNAAAGAGAGRRTRLGRRGRRARRWRSRRRSRARAAPGPGRMPVQFGPGRPGRR